MKSALITGGLGFVGSHLVDELLADGYKVTIVDNLISNVAQPEEYAKNSTIILAPIEDTWQQLTPENGHQFSEIYHMASVVGPAGVLKHAGDIARSVIYSHEAVVNLALQHKARLILASTSEVYGHTRSFNENDPCIIPSKYTVRLEYAAAKLTSEISAINRALVTDLHVNVIRPFNISGARQLPEGGFVLPRFVVAALTGQPLTVFGDGRQVRAFTDVRDIVSGMRLAMASDHKSEVFNLGNAANELSIRSLAERVVAHIGSSAPIHHVDPKELFGPLYEEGFEKVPDATKANKMLNWFPKLTLEDTIEATVQHYRKHPELMESQDEAKVSLLGR